MKPDEPIAQKNIITRGLPKTGQVTSYLAGDDGTFEAGWWKGRLNANNRTRFLTRTLAGDDIVKDRATGLMWARDGLAAGCNNGALITWADAIVYCNFLNFGGFEDWRLPNVMELLSICNWSIVSPTAWPVFTDWQPLNYIGYWTSTTYIGNTLNAWYVRFNGGQNVTALKTSTKYLRAVRSGL